MSDPRPFVGDISLLTSHALFVGIEEEALKKFLCFLKQHDYPAGKAIIREGESGDKLYLILSGSVEVEKKILAKEGISSERIAILRAGETFGEMELVDRQPRSATIRTLEDTTVLSLSERDIQEATDTDAKTWAKIVLNLTREISIRLRRTDEWFAGSLFSIKNS